MTDVFKRERLLSFTSVTMSQTDSSAARTAEPVKVRSINALSLACMGYLAICAGPYGIEDAVGAAGALPVFIAILTLPFLWGLPQALMTAELSTMMDENGGYVSIHQRYEVIFLTNLAGIMGQAGNGTVLGLD